MGTNDSVCTMGASWANPDMIVGSTKFPGLSITCKSFTKINLIFKNKRQQFKTQVIRPSLTLSSIYTHFTTWKKKAFFQTERVCRRQFYN